MKILYVSDVNYPLKIASNGNDHHREYWFNLICNTHSKFLWVNYGINKGEIIEFGPDIILVFDCQQLSPSTNECLEFCKTLGKPIALLLDDFFYPKILQRSRIDLIDAIIFKVRQEETRLEYERLFPNKIIRSFDQYINTDVFHPQNTEKEYDILVYGSRTFIHNTSDYFFPLNNVHEEYLRKWKLKNGTDVLPARLNFYEFRKRVTDLILSLKDEYRIKVLEEKGSFDAEIKNEALSVEISKAYLSLCTKTCIDKCMMKYLETAASDTVILGDIPTDYRYVFSNNIIEIHEDMTDNQILSIIRASLNDKKNLLEMGKRFGQKIRDLYGKRTMYTVKYALNVLDSISIEYHHKKILNS